MNPFEQKRSLMFQCKVQILQGEGLEHVIFHATGPPMGDRRHIFEVHCLF